MVFGRVIYDWCILYYKLIMILSLKLKQVFFFVFVCDLRTYRLILICKKLKSL